MNIPTLPTIDPQRIGSNIQEAVNVLAQLGEHVAAQSSGAMCARCFGCVGDGITDDTLAMRSFLEACRDQHVGAYIPAGVYRVMGSLTVYPNMRVFGDGCGSTTIYYAGIVLGGTGTGPDSSFNGTAYHLFVSLPGPAAGVVRQQNIVIEHLRIVGDNGASDVNPSAPAFKVTYLGIQAQAFAIYLPGVGASNQGPSSDVWVRHCRFENLFGFSNRSDGGGTRQHFTGNHLRYVAGDTNFNADDSLVVDNTFDHCWGIENAGAHVTIARNVLTNGIGPSNISVGGGSGDTFYTGDNGPGQRGIFGSKVVDNVIDGGVGIGILVNSGCVGTIVARNFITRIPANNHGISQNTEFGESTVPSYCTVEDNVFMSIGMWAIWFGQGGFRNSFRRNKILRNQIDGALDTFGGILVQYEVDAIVEGNESSANGYDYYFVDVVRLVFANNTGPLITFADVTTPSTSRETIRTQTIDAGGSVAVSLLVCSVYVTYNGASSPLVPDPARLSAGHRITINNASTQAGATTITPAAGTIAGQANLVITGAWASATIESNGVNAYHVVYRTP